MSLRLFLFFLVLSLAFKTTAVTPQSPDWIIYQGKKYPLLCNPLESFFEDNNTRPRFMLSPGQFYSGNQRGYQATWEIQDNRLYLTNIDGWICGLEDPKKCVRVKLDQLFGDNYQNDRVFADWYDGELRLANGKVKRAVWAGYASVFEHELFITIKQGAVVSTRNEDNSNRNFELEEQHEYDELKKKEPLGKPSPSPLDK